MLIVEQMVGLQQMQELVVLGEAVLVDHTGPEQPAEMVAPLGLQQVEEAGVAVRRTEGVQDLIVAPLPVVMAVQLRIQLLVEPVALLVWLVELVRMDQAVVEVDLVLRQRWVELAVRVMPLMRRMDLAVVVAVAVVIPLVVQELMGLPEDLLVVAEEAVDRGLAQFMALVARLLQGALFLPIQFPVAARSRHFYLLH